MFRKLLLAALCCVPSIAHAEWQEAISRHFIVYSDDTPEHVRAFTIRLERFDQAIRFWHMAPQDKYGPSARVTVYVLDDTDDIAKLAGADGIAGFYVPIAGRSVAFTPRNSSDISRRAILFHEYTHHWMLTNWADAAFPPWFVEGFAEMHATAMIRPDGSVVFGAPPLYRQWTVGNMSLLPSERLLRSDPGKLDGATRDALYSRGWLLTHYLTFDDERRGQLAAYIGAINAGKSAEEASKILGDAARLDYKLTSYAQRPLFPSALIPADKLTIGEIAIRQLTPAQAAMMPASILSNRGVSPEAAPKVAALARKLAAPYPNDPWAQNELAEAEYDAKNYAAAEAAADRALAADPKSIHALLYKGMAQEAAAVAAKESDPAKWQAIRRWFLAANKVDTEAPQPLAAYYDSFDAAGQKPTANAQAALLYAYALAPYDTTLRMRAALVYLQQDKVHEARVALAPVAYNVEGRSTSDAARKVLTAIEGGNAAAGIAAIEEMTLKGDEKAKADPGKGGDKQS